MPETNETKRPLNDSSQSTEHKNSAGSQGGSHDASPKQGNPSQGNPLGNPLGNQGGEVFSHNHSSAPEQPVPTPASPVTNHTMPSGSSSSSLASSPESDTNVDSPPNGSTEGQRGSDGRTTERPKGERPRARGTAAMDPKTRQEVARKGGLAVSRNKSHMADIGRKGGQTVSKNRDHMASIGRKGGEASRGHR